MAFHKQYIRRYRGPGIPEQVRPYFYDFHLLTMEGEYEYPSHRHAEYELILVDHGPYRCCLNQTELVVPDARALIIKPGDVHQDHLHDGQCHHVLHFGLGNCSGGPQLFREGASAQEQVTHSRITGHGRFFQELEEEIRKGDAFSGGLQDALLEAFFWRVVRCLPAEGLSSAFRRADRQGEFVRSLYAFFESRNGRAVEVDEMAGALHVSRRTLTNHCREYLNESPARACLRYRLEKAAEMLQQTGWTVQTISLELGFDSPFHFSRAFRRIYGISPSAFREK